jgi:hypothetical protein
MVIHSGMISLGGGLPSSENFPIEELSIKVPSPPSFSEPENQSFGKIATAKKHDIREGTSLLGEKCPLMGMKNVLLTCGFRPGSSSQLWPVYWFWSIIAIRNRTH